MSGKQCPGRCLRLFTSASGGLSKPVLSIVKEGFGPRSPGVCLPRARPEGRSARALGTEGFDKLSPNGEGRYPLVLSLSKDFGPRHRPGLRIMGADERGTTCRRLHLFPLILSLSKPVLSEAEGDESSTA